MDFVLGRDDESTYSNDRFHEVYSHENESFDSRGRFKALDSEEYEDKLDQHSLDESTLDVRSFDKRGSQEVYEDTTVERCESSESQTFQENTCTNILIETFRINPKEIVVKIMAFAIPSQTKLLEPCCEEFPLPNTPGFACVGRVMTQTPSFCDIQLNDRVLVLLPEEKQARFETFANVPFDAVMKINNDIDPFVQLSLVFTYLPALQILQTLSHSVKNKKVILNGGIGPVIRSLVHLCRLHGAKKVLVPCQRQHKEIVRKIGGKTLGTRHCDWGPSHIEDVDVVVDAIGENSYVTSQAVLNEKGVLVVIGNTHNSFQDDTVFNNLNKKVLNMRLKNSAKTTIFNFNANYEKDIDGFLQDFDYLCTLIADGRINAMFTKISRGQYSESDDLETTLLESPLLCDPWM